MKIKVIDYNNLPFWSQENDLMEARNNLERDCWDAHNLFDAILTGANSIRLDGEFVGWVGEDGIPDIDDYFMEANKLDLYDNNGKFVGKEKLRAIEVEFDTLDRDDDGYTIALFKRVEK